MTTKVKEKEEARKEVISIESKRKYFFGRGRRKEASAQVRIYPGKGQVTVNKKLLSDYFPAEVLSKNVIFPLELTGNLGKFDVSVIVKGGGKNGQAEATRLGIARALVVFSPDLRSSLRKAGLLTRDPREKERKKYGLRRARKAAQSPKR